MSEPGLRHTRHSEFVLAPTICIQCETAWEAHLFFLHLPSSAGCHFLKMSVDEDVSWRRCQLGMPVESASCWRCQLTIYMQSITKKNVLVWSRRHSGRSSSPQTVSCVPCSIVRTCVQSGSLLFSRQMQITPTSLLQIKTKAHCRAEPFFCTSPSCHFVVVEISFHHWSEVKWIHTAVISWVNSAVYTTGNFNWQLHFGPKKILQLIPARIANCHTWVENT